MPTISGIYDNGPISPVVKIKENISILTGGSWSHYLVDYIEPLPRSSPMVADLVAISGGVTIPANGAINQQLIVFLRLNDKELIHLRFEPVDDVEVLLWEQASTGKFGTNYVRARASVFSAARDPWLATTTFFVVGKDRDANIEVRNPNPVALPQARVAFWGYRYILENLPRAPAVTTYLPAEGRQG